MDEEEQKAWVNAIISLCEVQQLGGEAVYAHLRGILVDGQPVLDDYPLSAWVLADLDPAYQVRYMPRQSETPHRTSWCRGWCGETTSGFQHGPFCGLPK